MTRLGAAILALVVLSIAGFATMLSFGPRAVPAPPVPEKRAAPLPAPPSPGAALAIPVEGTSPAQLVDSWGEARAGGARNHQAIDIMAPANTPVRAAAPGTVEKLFTSAAGGLTLYVRTPDRRWSHYYAHLAGYAPGVHEGQRVGRGALLGYVGDTGNAAPGNTHLHFGVSRMAPGARWHEGTPVNPYPLLAGQHKVR